MLKIQLNQNFFQGQTIALIYAVIGLNIRTLNALKYWRKKRQKRRP